MARASKAPARGAAPRRPARKAGVPLRQRLSAAVPWMLVSGVAVLLLTLVIYLPAMLDAYPVRQVGVKGVTDARRQQQLETALAALVRDENYFTVPLEKIYRQARALSWVRDVSVRRQWPDKVVLAVTERKPLAVWNGSVLVSDSGEPFKALKQYDLQGLPRLSGPPQRLDEVMGFYHSMGKLLADVGLTIKSMEVNARLTARLTLNNGLQLVVDREHYATKLRRFVRLYRGVLSTDSRQAARVDLRYADGMAVTWQQS
ncbi:cell division protein FtsQ [Alcanivorax hongdengensis A-11-3]|uniref:Cell division protein FtsQ n=1 Tax=Alcanivorax hongdengensis A-11-3 TaxID=1177179 RepID=L0WBB6_9GAMM|nr:cell division protein FtsQ/DivIB [Alcanivorax hongdengensis]EKF74261.1 cell division protein FtsQ [Alcanivorax hongdengensis A-11-3]